MYLYWFPSLISHAPADANMCAPSHALTLFANVWVMFYLGLIPTIGSYGNYKPTSIDKLLGIPDQGFVFAK